MSVVQLQLQLAKMLGLDSTRLKAFTLRVEVGQMPTVEATYLMFTSEHAKPEELTQKFDLVPHHER